MMPPALCAALGVHGAHGEWARWWLTLPSESSDPDFTCLMRPRAFDFEIKTISHGMCFFSNKINTIYGVEEQHSKWPSRGGRKGDKTLCMCSKMLNKINEKNVAQYNWDSSY